MYVLRTSTILENLHFFLKEDMGNNTINIHMNYRMYAYLQLNWKQNSFYNTKLTFELTYYVLCIMYYVCTSIDSFHNLSYALY